MSDKTVRSESEEAAYQQGILEGRQQAAYAAGIRAGKLQFSIEETGRGYGQGLRPSEPGEVVSHPADPTSVQKDKSVVDPKTVTLSEGLVIALEAAAMHVLNLDPKELFGESIAAGMEPKVLNKIQTDAYNIVKNTISPYLG